MAAALPLFELQALKAIRDEREALLKKLKRGGVPALTRIRRQEKLKRLTAEQMLIEKRCGLGQAGGRYG